MRIYKILATCAILTISVSCFFPLATEAAPLSKTDICNVIGRGVSVGVKETPKEITAGSELVVKGMVKNANEYPINGVRLVAILAKLDRKTGGRYDMAKDRVARIEVSEGKYIAASSQRSFTMTYDVPENMPSGAYLLNFFIDGDGQLILGGNEYLGTPVGVLPLKILGSASAATFIDQSSIKVNNREPFTSDVVDVEGSDRAVVSLAVENTYPTARTVSMTWKVYRSMIASDTNLVSEKTESIEIPANGRKTVSFLAEGLVKSSNLVSAEINDHGKTSLGSVRINRTDIFGPVILTAGIGDFPFENDSSSKAFACVSTNQFGPALPTTVKISLIDRLDKQIYAGSFVKSATVRAEPFLAKFDVGQNIKYPVTLTVTAFDQAGNAKASYSSVYSCKSAGCGGLSQSFYTIYLPLIIVLVLVVMIAIIKKRNV